MDAPFYSPRSAQSGNTIDWRWLIAMIGVDLEEVSPDLPLVLRQLLVDKHYLYRSISSEPLTTMVGDDVMEPSSLTYDVLTADDMANVVGISLELCNAKGNMELLLISRDYNGKLHFIPESTFVPPFGGKFYDRPSGRVINFKTAMADVVAPTWKEWRGSREFPRPVPESIAKRLSIMTGPVRMSKDEAQCLAQHMLEDMKIPYFDRGRLIQPGVGRASEELAIPELAEDRRKQEREEGLALNPEFGALAF